MALTFDGANDNTSLATGAGVVDTAARSIGVWVNLPTDPVAMALFTTGLSLASGQQQDVLNAITPGTAGFRVRYSYAWNAGATNAVWEYQTDVSLNAWHHLLITYDRGSTTNDPLIYVDGVSVTVTETVAPTGTARTGAAAYRLGENVAGGADLNGTLAELGYWNRALSADEARGLGTPGKAFAPSCYPRGLVLYKPLIRDATTTRELRNGLNGTISGGPTVAAHPRIIYPVGVTA